jgi:phosphoserine phosphatase RsbU/P
VLGAVPKLELEPYRISLDSGDALVMFTDGVLEARSEEGVFGEDGLRRLLGTLLSATAKDIAEQVARHAIDFQAGAPRDDLAVLVARRRAEDAPPVSGDPDGLAAAGATPRDVTS